MTKGHGLLSLDNKNYPVKEDDLVIVNPLVSHTERGIENVNFEYIVMGIEGITFFSKKNTKNRVAVLPTIMNTNTKYYSI
ncbi:MAG: AraC family ligand binding domain-containing protein [Holdemanella porci]